MSQAELDALERDVERSRAKFDSDLARLRSPGIISSFKDDLWAETSGAVKDGAQKILDDLKRRASANPAAALAIGAGLTWRSPPASDCKLVGRRGADQPPANGAF